MAAGIKLRRVASRRGPHVNLTSEQLGGAIINAASALIALAALGLGIFRSASARCMKPGFLPSMAP